MKIRFILLFVLITALCLSFSACGDGETVDSNDALSDSALDTNAVDGTDTESTHTSDTLADTDPESTVKNIVIGNTDISNFSIVAPGDDAVALTIADYFAEKVKAFTGNEMSIVETAENSAAAVVIGNTAITPDFGIGEDEFIIKAEEDKLYISYDEGASAYQAVTAILDDVLFSDENAVEDTYSLSSDYEFIGKCGDYVIGDNEFNPFE
ncbi:MAG: hypothetical protein IJZ89_01430 [Clostridia bacterium]|nr:hypothetical protein [Clostridia bacterium]